MKNEKTDVKDPEDIDEIYERYKDFDFDDPKHSHDVPHLARLRAEEAYKAEKAGSSVITIRIQNQTLAAIKTLAGGKGYQTVINRILEEYVLADGIAEVIRKTIREELAK